MIIKIHQFHILCLLILLSFPSVTIAGGFKWTVGYYMDTGDGKQEVKIELPEVIEGRYWSIPNLYGEWKCGVTYQGDDPIPSGYLSSRSFGCFPVDNIKYSVSAMMYCSSKDTPTNSLIYLFGNNMLNIQCKPK